MKLLEPIDLQDRVVCADNWFTGLKLVIAIRERGGHFVGTMKEKPYLPSKYVTKVGLQENDSLALYNHRHDVMVVYLKVKEKKSVRVLSSLHGSITEVEGRKTEPIMFYNGAKSGVDGFDKMCANSSVSRKTARWPLCIKYGQINIVMNNAFIIAKHLPAPPRSKIDFFMTVAWELARPFASNRYDHTRNLALDIKYGLAKNFNLGQFLGQDAPAPQGQPALPEPVVEAQAPQPEPEPQPAEPEAEAQVPQLEPEPQNPNAVRYVQPRRRERRNERGLPQGMDPLPPPPPPGIPSGNLSLRGRSRCLYCVNVASQGKMVCHRCCAPVCYAHSRRLCHGCFN